MNESSERRDWSEAEVEATVAAYLDMLLLELQDRPYNKAERRRQLQLLLERRTEGAIERKHQNISAILIEMGFPYVDGYKPLRNVQELLRQVVQQHVTVRPDFLALVSSEIQRAATVPTVDDILSSLVDPPVQRLGISPPRLRDRPPASFGDPRPNYLALEAQNSELGLAGEQFVVNFERARLLAAGADSLADRVEHVSLSRGDHLGFDVLSFDSGGRDRLIEVKTTGFGPYTSFFVTRNELAVSQLESECYSVYRVFAFRRAPRLFALPGAIDESCELEASQYVARVG